MAGLCGIHEENPPSTVRPRSRQRARTEARFLSKRMCQLADSSRRPWPRDLRNVQRCKRFQAVCGHPRRIECCRFDRKCEGSNMRLDTFVFAADSRGSPVARKSRQSAAKPTRRKTQHSPKRTSTQQAEQRKPESPPAESGRLQHRDRQRSEDSDREPHRGEISQGQES